MTEKCVEARGEARARPLVATVAEGGYEKRLTEVVLRRWSLRFSVLPSRERDTVPWFHHWRAFGIANARAAL